MHLADRYETDKYYSCNCLLSRAQFNRNEMYIVMTSSGWKHSLVFCICHFVIVLEFPDGFSDVFGLEWSL